jgi:hypothetical protein
MTYAGAGDVDEYADVGAAATNTPEATAPPATAPESPEPTPTAIDVVADTGAGDDGSADAAPDAGADAGGGMDDFDFFAMLAADSNTAVAQDTDWTMDKEEGDYATADAHLEGTVLFFPTEIFTRGCHWFPRLLAPLEVLACV